MPLLRLNPLALALTLPLAFSSSVPATPSTSDFPSTGPIRIVAVSPEKGTVLRKGHRVELSLTLASHVDDPGQVVLSLRDQSGNRLIPPVAPVALNARGEARLRASLVVPSGAASVLVCANFVPSAGTPTAVCLPFRTR